jgi:hypothetical protein
MTWSVTCPKWTSKDHANKAHTWLLPPKEVAKIGNRYFDSLIECIVCEHKFSLQEGVKESFLSDNPFVIHEIQYDAFEYGNVEIIVGKLKKVEFSEPFEDPPEIYLTPYEKPIAVVPGFITKTRFSILSSDSETAGKTRKITWIAYGNRARGPIPIWRKLLSSSKKYQLRKDFRSELVFLESAFEVFIHEYLGKNLRTRLRDETVDWMLKRSIEEQLKIGFMELTGNTLSDIEPKAYRRWQRSVKELRDSVLHRGALVTSDQAREARDATFDLITRIDPTTIHYFARPILTI